MRAAERCTGHTVTLALFWSSIFVVAYTYVLFPVLVIARGLIRHRPPRLGDARPPVSVLIAARNEQDVIAERIDNLLASDYPADHLEVIVASDGSDDATNVIVGSYPDERVRLLALPRVGKAQALNAAVKAASNEILVFSDANSMYLRTTISELVRPFADPVVGGVAGDQRYAAATHAGGLGSGERRYWSFDRLLKSAESRAGSTISATGAVYALRRELVDPIIEGVTDDFYTSTGVIARGRRLVFHREAVAMEPPAATGHAEFARKVRIMTRGLRGVQARRELLNPRQYGFYSLQLLSHKVLRRLVTLPLVVIGVTTPALRRRGGMYRAAAIGQAAFYVSAVAGFWRAGRNRGRADELLQLPAYVCLVNAAALRALWNLVTGAHIDRWEPQRGQV